MDENVKQYKLKEEEIKNLINWQGADGCIATDKITVEGCKVRLYV